MPSASRLQLSMTLGSLNVLVSDSLSCIKPINQTQLILSGTAKDSGFSLFKHLYGFIRRFSSNSL
jgi:hypothetical protein